MTLFRLSAIAVSNAAAQLVGLALLLTMKPGALRLGLVTLLCAALVANVVMFADIVRLRRRLR